MSRKFILLALLIATVSVSWGALQGARTVVTSVDDAPAVKTTTGLSYESFLEAVAFWDLEAAGRMAQRDDQLQYLQAMQALMDGDESSAEKLLRAVRTRSGDSSLTGLATSLLEQITFADDRWDDFRKLRDGGDSGDPFSVLVESLAGGPAQTWTIPDKPSIVPTTPDAGLPTLRVMVNGKPFDFILDTGAPFTVVNADVAAAAGIRPAGERTGLIRNDVRGRPARMDRLELGAIVVRHHPVMIVPVDGMTIPERPSENKTIQGILGWPLIRRLDIEIDLAGGQTTIRKPRREPDGNRNLFFCFRPLVVARDPGGMPLHFLLDTGTDGTTLLNRIGKKTRFSKVKDIKVGTSRIGETGKVAQGRMLPKFLIYIGDHRIGFKNIALLNGSYVDGILGTDVHTLRPVRIDYTNGHYTLLD